MSIKNAIKRGNPEISETFGFPEYQALQLSKIVRPDGTWFYPVNGIYKPQTEWEDQALIYFAALNQSLLVKVENT